MFPEVRVAPVPAPQVESPVGGAGYKLDTVQPVTLVIDAGHVAAGVPVLVNARGPNVIRPKFTSPLNALTVLYKAQRA